jgi:hypothetical protein
VRRITAPVPRQAQPDGDDAARLEQADVLSTEPTGTSHASTISLTLHAAAA